MAKTAGANPRSHWKPGVIFCVVVCVRKCTVHDTENLTFSKEFRGCSTWTPADCCAE